MARWHAASMVARAVRRPRQSEVGCRLKRDLARSSHKLLGEPKREAAHDVRSGLLASDNRAITPDLEHGDRQTLVANCKVEHPVLTARGGMERQPGLLVHGGS